MTLSCSFAWIRRLVACLLLIGLVVGNGSTVFADKPTKIVRYEGRLEVQPNGDVIAREQMHFPTLAYLEAKSQHGGPVALFRMLQQSFAWSVTEDMKFQLDDQNSRLHVDFRQVGAVRSIGKNRWSLDFINGAEMELVSLQDNKVVLTGATESGFGVMSHTTYVTLPSTSSDVKLAKNGKGIEYVYEPPLEPGDECQATFDLESKKHLMSSLASVYSNREFPQFWAARSIFKNTGDQLIQRYRVRFRIPNHTGWSEWAKSERVYPGQSVIDPYFPVFDLESISKLTTSRRIAVEIEYEYQRADGETIKETETTRLELLARNQVVFGGRENGESITWHEQNEYLPFVMAAFCTSDDPVIQQLAGRVSGMGNGLAASLNDEAAIAFLQSLWLFMEHNRIVYQTPPTLQMNNTFGQNIKYARDVLRNRAGTCIDLAVFWASAAKAVGLEAHVVLIPGHAYPVIKLPGGQMVPIEATLIGRGTIRDAVETGMKNLAELNAKPNFEVSVSEYQNAGIRCLELPAVSDNWLEEQKYEFPNMVQETHRVTYEEPSSTAGSGTESSGTATSGTEPSGTESRPDAELRSTLTGRTWNTPIQVPGQQGAQGFWLTKFKADGTFVELTVNTESVVTSQKEGQYTLHADTLTMTTGEVMHWTGRVIVHSSEAISFIYPDGQTVPAKAALQGDPPPAAMTGIWEANCNQDGREISYIFELDANGVWFFGVWSQVNGQWVRDSLEEGRLIVSQRLLMFEPKENEAFTRRYELSGDTFTWIFVDGSNRCLTFQRQRKTNH